MLISLKWRILVRFIIYCNLITNLRELMKVFIRLYMKAILFTSLALKDIWFYFKMAYYLTQIVEIMLAIYLI